MNKVVAFMAVFLVMIASVLACHCEDTDEAKDIPEWGDNMALGGTSLYYLAPYEDAPEGCTGSYGHYTCNDVCLGDSYTLREFYCAGNSTVSYIYWEDYENNAQCGYEEVPEFGFATGAIALLGAAGALLFFKRK